jgi:hypothetical protein
MRFNEFKQPTLKAYRIVVLLSDNSSAETLIYADTPENAWLIASKQYGSKKIVSVIEGIGEQKKAPSAEQLRIKSLDDQAKRYRDLARQAKAQDRLKKAQQSVEKAAKSIT